MESARWRCLALALLLSGHCAQSAPAGSFPENLPATVSAALGERQGVFVIQDLESGEIFASDAELAEARVAPCSTFKIWNTLLGMESGILHGPEDAFYSWDGVRREYPGWNADSTLKQAFQASNVPAFQALARTIGEERMRAWIDQISYGNRDMSSGLDVFWLPAEGRQPILISPKEQVRLLRELFSGTLKVKQTSLENLRKVMEVSRAEDVVIYGKTGSSSFAGIGWFVGVLESNNKAYAFACLLRGDGVSGPVARGVAEEVLAGFSRSNPEKN